MRLMRFANRVPLLYQQSACAVFRAAVKTDWRNYQLTQPKGALPLGPMVVFIHVASAWVPFTSESKEAIAHYPEIIKEIRPRLAGVRPADGSAHQPPEEEGGRGEEALLHRQLHPPHRRRVEGQFLALKEKEREKVVSNLRVVLEKSRKP